MAQVPGAHRSPQADHADLRARWSQTPDGLAFAKEVFAKAKPGYHPITIGSVQAVIDEAAAKSAATPAGPGKPSAGQTATAPESLHPSDPVPMPAETR